MTRPLFKRLIKSCALAVVLIIAVDGVAKAESQYPRTQVENHLRAMFVNVDSFIELSEKNLPPEYFSRDLAGFDFFVGKKKVQAYFFGIKKEEIESGRAILDNLFSDILGISLSVVDPYKEEFDLIVYLSDNLAFDAMSPRYMSLLKGNSSEKTYIKNLRGSETSRTVYMTPRYLRDTGEPLSVVATERYTPEQAEAYSFETQFRYMLFVALTGARFSDVIQPSAVNDPSTMNKHDGFTPIDRAVLRAIFGHDDWSGLAYKQKMKLLTNRVMEQLNGMSSNAFIDGHSAHDQPGKMT